MPPKPQEKSEAKFIFVKCWGGEIPPAAILAPKLAPLGVNVKKLGEDAKKFTAGWPTIRIMLEIKVENRNYELRIIETTSALVVKALGEKKRDRKTEKLKEGHQGNITYAKIKEIAKAIQPRSMAKNFQGTIKEVLGTCVSIGITVDKKSPKVIQKLIDDEEYDVEEPQFNNL